MNSFMNARDAVSAPLAECYVTVGGNRYNFMQAIDLEAVIERTKAEVPILGQTGRGNKATGWRGKGSATFHYNTSIFRELMYRFKTHGEDVYFDIQVSNEDPTSAAGRQTVVLKGCNINSGILAKFDADAEFLSEDICCKGWLSKDGQSLLIQRGGRPVCSRTRRYSGKGATYSNRRLGPACGSRWSIKSGNGVPL